MKKVRSFENRGIKLCIYIYFFLVMTAQASCILFSCYNALEIFRNRVLYGNI